MDRFRHASFVEETSFISTRPERERKGGWEGGISALRRLFLSLSLLLSRHSALREEAATDTEDARTAARQAATMVLCASCASSRERLTALFREGSASRTRGLRYGEENILVNELTSSRVHVRAARAERVKEADTDGNRTRHKETTCEETT